MTNRQIETSREIRLWIRDIIVPSIGVGATVLWLHPEIKDNIKDVGDAAKKASDDIASATNKASSKSTEAGNKIKINWKSIAAGIGNAVKKVG